MLPSLNQEHNLLVVSHQAVIRCLLAFLMGSTPGRDVPYIKVPLHCVLKVTLREGENRVEFHRLPVECVDTYRPRAEAAQKAEPDKRHSNSVLGKSECHSLAV